MKKPTLKQIRELKKLIKKYESLDYSKVKKDKVYFESEIRDMFKLNMFAHCNLCREFEKCNMSLNCDKCPYAFFKKGEEHRYCLDDNNVLRTKSYQGIKNATNLAQFKKAITYRIKFIEKVISKLEEMRKH